MSNHLTLRITLAKFAPEEYSASMLVEAAFASANRFVDGVDPIKWHLAFPKKNKY